MAINAGPGNKLWAGPIYNPDRIVETSYDVKEVAIGGKLLTVVTEISNAELEFLKITAKNIIKQKLVEILAEKMLKEDLVSLTQQFDHNHDTTKILCRCYLAPSDQVKLLRVALTNPNLLP